MFRLSQVQAANKDGTGCYTKGMISAAMTRVRQLMSKDWRQVGTEGCAEAGPAGRDPEDDLHHVE
jgi:hypothetical protein